MKLPKISSPEADGSIDQDVGVDAFLLSQLLLIFNWVQIVASKPTQHHKVKGFYIVEIGYSAHHGRIVSARECENLVDKAEVTLRQ